MFWITSLEIFFVAVIFAGTSFWITKRVGWTMLGLSLCLIGSLFTPVVAENLFKADKLTFDENINVYVVAVDKNDPSCGVNGACFYSFKCHHWVKTIHHPASKSCSTSNGKTTCTTIPAYDTYEDEWDMCPYASSELNLSLKTSIGTTISLGDHRFLANPQLHRYMENGVIPEAWHDSNELTPEMEKEAGVGYPPEFLEAQQDLAMGKSMAVTLRSTYLNYIEADRNSIQNYTSPDVAVDLKKGILPQINSTFHTGTYTQMDRAFFVGVSPPGGLSLWEKTLQNFDSALGTLDQGDLYLVAIDAAKAGNILAYGNALMTYWTDPSLQAHGKEHDTLSKNGVVIVTTISNGTIVDARGFTMIKAGSQTTVSKNGGSKDGDVDMLRELQQELVGQPLDPLQVIGNPTASLVNGKVTITPAATPGVIERVALWSSIHFVRQHMTDKHPSANGGFTYLDIDIQPTGDDLFHWWLVGVLICLFASAMTTAFGMWRNTMSDSPPWTYSSKERFY